MDDLGVIGSTAIIENELGDTLIGVRVADIVVALILIEECGKHGGLLGEVGGVGESDAPVGLNILGLAGLCDEDEE